MREPLLGEGNDYSNPIDHQSTQCHKKNPLLNIKSQINIHIPSSPEGSFR